MNKKHHKYTDSDVAAAIIGNWAQAKASFVKVIPEDYKKVIEAQKAARLNASSKEAVNG